MRLGRWGLSLPKHLTPTLHPPKKDKCNWNKHILSNRVKRPFPFSEHPRKRAVFPLPVCWWCDCRSGSTLPWRGRVKSSQSEATRPGPERIQLCFLIPPNRNLVCQTWESRPNNSKMSRSIIMKVRYVVKQVNGPFGLSSTRGISALNNKNHCDCFHKLWI